LPEAKGFDASVYVLPVVGGALALAGVALMLARWRRRGRDKPAAPSRRRTRTEDLLLEAELDRLR
jgi:hypothetical protein